MRIISLQILPLTINQPTEIMSCMCAGLNGCYLAISCNVLSLNTVIIITCLQNCWVGCLTINCSLFTEEIFQFVLVSTESRNT